MHTPILTFFNNKGGVGKTSLVYHLSWMLSLLGERILAVDLDPQANLTAHFMDENELELSWERPEGADTIYRAIEPTTKMADIQEARLHHAADRLDLIPGDLALAGFEDSLSEAWPRCLGESSLYRNFRIQAAFWIVAQRAAEKVGASMILADVGPNLGAINRSALIASDAVVIPLAADLFSLQGLKNLGPTLRRWRGEWNTRLGTWKAPEFDLPPGSMKPVGYIVQQHSMRLDRPVQAYDKWLNRIPSTYRECVLKEGTTATMKPKDDPLCLATLRHYRSLVPLAQEARKPIFELTAAEGAVGSHAKAVAEAYADFEALALRIRGLVLPQLPAVQNAVAHEIAGASSAGPRQGK